MQLHGSFAAPQPVAQDLAALFERLGFAAIVRDPDSAEVIAASPHAETKILAAPPGAVRLASARIGGVALRVEVVHAEKAEPLTLTPRQHAVALLLLGGLRNHEIGAKLGISTHTVRRHVEAILRRLEVNDRVAAAEALRKGRVRL